MEISHLGRLPIRDASVRLLTPDAPEDGYYERVRTEPDI